MVRRRHELSIDPTLIEDGNHALHLYLASDDGDDDRNIARDGKPDCQSLGGPTGSYVGLGIYEANVDAADPKPTTTTLRLPQQTVSPGERVHFIVDVRSDTGSPRGFVQVLSDAFSIQAPVIDGHAELDVRTFFKGEYTARAIFSSDALWASSTSASVPLHVVAPARRRATAH